MEIQGKELLNAHLDALYTKHGVYLEKINEPWGFEARAPKLHICAGVQGDVLVGKLEKFCPGEMLQIKEQECC